MQPEGIHGGAIQHGNEISILFSLVTVVDIN